METTKQYNLFEDDSLIANYNDDKFNNQKDIQSNCINKFLDFPWDRFKDPNYIHSNSVDSFYWRKWQLKSLSTLLKKNKNSFYQFIDNMPDFMLFKITDEQFNGITNDAKELQIIQNKLIEKCGSEYIINNFNLYFSNNHSNLSQWYMDFLYLYINDNSISVFKKTNFKKIKNPNNFQWQK